MESLRLVSDTLVSSKAVTKSSLKGVHEMEAPVSSTIGMLEEDPPVRNTECTSCVSGEVVLATRAKLGISMVCTWTAAVAA